MRAIEIEHWALRVVSRVTEHQPLEDARVELKSKWPLPIDAARRIAGHANAAHGEPILWLIGVDEKAGVVGAQQQEMASWYQAVTHQFVELWPRVEDVNVPIDDKTIVALLFETDRAPFVVKNPAHGQPKGGPVAYEVPWRESTAIRTAKRSDLIMLLMPIQKLPGVEVIDGELTVRCNRSDPSETILCWSLLLTLYLVPQSEAPLFIPFHYCSAWCTISDVSDRMQLLNIRLAPPWIGGGAGGRSVSLTMESTPTELIASGPGTAKMSAEGETKELTLGEDDTASIDITLRPVGANIPVVLTIALDRAPAVNIDDPYGHSVHEAVRWVCRREGCP